MVYPAIVRKVNSKKIISKATKPDYQIRSDLESAQVPSLRNYTTQISNESVQHHMRRSNQGPGLKVVKHRSGLNIERDALFFKPKKVGCVASSNSNVTQDGNESEQPHMMRNTREPGLNVVKHRSGQDIEIDVVLSRPRKVGYVPISENNVPQVGNESTQPPMVRDTRGAGPSISKRPRKLHDINALSPLVSDFGILGSSISANTQTSSLPDVGIIGSSMSTMPCNVHHDGSTQTGSVPDVDIIGSSKPKRKRGKTKGFKLAKTLEYGQRFEILFPIHVNRPVGQYSTMFTTEIGVLLRQIAPLQAKSWGVVSVEKKDAIMDRVRDKFIFSNESEVVESVKNIMARRYDNWRYRIHDKFLKYRTLVAALASQPPFGIEHDDWMFLCNLFCTKEFKEKSERNKKNRDKLRTTHCAGTKAYSKIRYDKRNPVTQMDLEFDEIYETAHKHSDGSWVHDNARVFHESLKENKMNAELEGMSISDEQLSVLTFGRKSGYICGLGYGPKPSTSVTGKRTRAALEREAYEAVKRAESAEKSAVDARKETAHLAERVKILEAEQADFSAKLRAEMSSQFALIHQQLLQSSMGQAQGKGGG